MNKLPAVLAAIAIGACVGAQRQPTDAEVAISNQLASLSSLPATQRVKAAREIAFQIRKLPAGPPKVSLASSLTSLTSLDDFGHGTLQAAANTLAVALREAPAVRKDAYVQLANLARYEGISVDLPTAGYAAALAEVDALNETRRKLDFTLADRSGKSWTLSQLKGKVVLLTFSPPANESLDELSSRFKERGLIVLALSNEQPEVVDANLKEHPVGYPVLLDPDRKVADMFQIEDAPTCLVYDRKGHLVAQSTGFPTMGRFLQMLSKAGLK